MGATVWTWITKGSLVTLVALAAVGVVSLFVPRVQELRRLQRREAEVRHEKELEEEMLRRLRRQQERLQTDPAYLERVARDELGYAKPGETIFRFVDEGETPTTR